MEKADGIMDFTWMAKRIFPEVLHQREVFRETKQGWLIRTKAGTSCCSGTKVQHWRDLCIHLKEGLVTSSLAVIAKSSQMYSTTSHGFSARMNYANEGFLASKPGDRWGTQQRSATPQGPHLHGSADPREVLVMLLHLLSSSRLQNIWRSTELQHGPWAHLKLRQYSYSWQGHGSCAGKQMLCAGRIFFSLLWPAFIIDGGSVPAVTINSQALTKISNFYKVLVL